MWNLTGSQCNRFRIGVERLKRGAWVTTLAGQFWTRCNLAISFSCILWNSYNNLTWYWPVPLQFAWQALRTDFFKFDVNHGCDRSMPYLFVIYVFGNSSYCRILHQDFWLMQMDLCLELELSMINYLGFFLAEVLLGLSFSLDPFIQATRPLHNVSNSREIP